MIDHPIPGTIKHPDLSRRGTGRTPTFALDISGYVYRAFATLRCRRWRFDRYSRKNQKKKIRETVPVSNATTGGDHLFTIRLVTPPALMTATCRCRRCRRRRCCRYGIFRSRVDDIAGRPQTLLELQQLTHEVQIRTDDWTRALHQLIRLHHRQALVSHYVGDCNRRAARHAGLTMYQHTTSGFPRFLWNTKTNCTMINVFLTMLIIA